MVLRCNLKGYKAIFIYQVHFTYISSTHPAYTCSKSTIEELQQSVKLTKLTIKTTESCQGLFQCVEFFSGTLF